MPFEQHAIRRPNCKYTTEDDCNIKREKKHVTQPSHVITRYATQCSTAAIIFETFQKVRKLYTIKI